MGEGERSGDGRKTGEEVDAGALFVLKSKGTFYIQIRTGYVYRFKMRIKTCNILIVSDLVYFLDKNIIYITEDNEC